MPYLIFQAFLTLAAAAAYTIFWLAGVGFAGGTVTLAVYAVASIFVIWFCEGDRVINLRRSDGWMQACESAKRSTDDEHARYSLMSDKLVAYNTQLKYQLDDQT